MREVAPGIILVGRFGPYKNACWVLHSGREAAVLEAPPHSPEESKPWELVEALLQSRGLRLRYVFVSHAHLDHCESLPHFRRRFPGARFVAHRRLVDDRTIHWLAGRNGLALENGVPGRLGFFDDVFRTVLWKGHLGHEPLYLLHAPKHSDSDHLLVFRGAMMTGDWFLGDLKDCNRYVSPGDKVRSVNRVVQALTRLDYHVHMMFSGHGDNLFYGVDFENMMAECKVDHG